MPASMFTQSRPTTRGLGFLDRLGLGGSIGGGGQVPIETLPAPVLHQVQSLVLRQLQRDSHSPALESHLDPKREL